FFAAIMASRTSSVTSRLSFNNVPSISIAINLYIRIAPFKSKYRKSGFSRHVLSSQSRRVSNYNRGWKCSRLIHDHGWKPSLLHHPWVSAPSSLQMENVLNQHPEVSVHNCKNDGWEILP